jgi:acylglycerol lipase
LFGIFLMGLCSLLCSANTAAPAAVTREDNTLARTVNLPVYVWQEHAIKPRGMVLAIHGMAMHGTAYDTWARRLAAEGFLVVAPDLRGYGSWLKTRDRAVAYSASEVDIENLAEAMRQENRGIPLVLAGESLGGSLAIRLAAKRADLFDGLILSAPALKHSHRVQWKTVAHTAWALAVPAHPINVSPYIENYYSEDPSICREETSDPLIRRNLRIGELVSSCRLIASTADCIADIPGDMPVLIMQGKNDMMVKASSLTVLKERLRTTRTTIRVFPNRGHILLETAYLQAETMDTVKRWLNENCHMRTATGTRVAKLKNEAEIARND